ncbi:MAG: serine/threonine-protein kinase [Cyanobacteria bacterium J06636_16]
MHEAHTTGNIIQSRYRILSVLGRGGSGITYAAEDLATQNRVALKELSLQGLSDWKKLELFEREAQVLASLDHPAIPDYVDYFQIDTVDNRFFYLVQALAEGKSLADWVTAGDRFTETEVRRIALEVLQILQYLHGLNPPVIHRDIKPQNIIRQKDGQIFLVDFGAVQTVYREATAFGSTVVGTYGYMAPEQFRGQAHLTTDLYGLGATLLNLLTHQSPSDLPQQRLKIDFRSQVSVSDAFVTWLDGLLEPLVEDRYDSASTAIAALTNPPPAKIQGSAIDDPSHLTQVRQPPAGSRVKFTRSHHQLSLQIPPRGLCFETLGWAFGTVILSFCAIRFTPALFQTFAGYRLWELRIVNLPVGMLATFLLVTCWVYGLGMAARTLNALFTHISLEVTGDRFTLARKIWGWQLVIKAGNTAHLERAELQVFDKQNSPSVDAIALYVGARAYKFGAHLSPPEKNWLVEELGTFIHEQRQFHR